MSAHQPRADSSTRPQGYPSERVFGAWFEGDTSQPPGDPDKIRCAISIADSKLDAWVRFAETPSGKRVLKAARQERANAPDSFEVRCLANIQMAVQEQMTLRAMLAVCFHQQGDRDACIAVLSEMVVLSTGCLSTYLPTFDKRISSTLARLVIETKAYENNWFRRALRMSGFNPERFRELIEEPARDRFPEERGQ